MKLVVGLGNPEDQHKGTRHNLGFEAIDELFRHIGSGSWEMDNKFKAHLAKVNHQLGDTNYDLILVKPQTFMNLSGEAVAKIAHFYKIKSPDIIVIHDELDLLLGKMKVRVGGGVGGHHGLESILESLGTDKFIRIRLGIGNAQGFLGEHKRVSFSAEKFVMEQFLPGERSKVHSMIKHCVDALETILEKGIEKAQNQFN